MSPGIAGGLPFELALLRNEGGSVGTSVGKNIVDRRGQFHTLRLNESLDRLNPTLDFAFHQGQSTFAQRTADPVAARDLTLESLQ